MNDLVKIHGYSFDEIDQEMARLEEIKNSLIIRKEIEKEMALERYYAGYARQRKGEAIIKSVNKHITPQKLGSNLGIFLKESNLRYCEINTLENIDRIALDFQEYMINKTKDDEFAQALATDDGLQSIKNYIASEALFARYEVGDLKDTDVAFYIGVTRLTRNNEKFMHQAFNKSVREGLKYISRDIKQNGLFLDDRQQGKFEAFMQIILQKQIQPFIEQLNEEMQTVKRNVLSHSKTPNQFLISRMEPK